MGFPEAAARFLAGSDSLHLRAGVGQHLQGQLARWERSGRAKIEKIAESKKEISKYYFNASEMITDWN